MEIIDVRARLARPERTTGTVSTVKRVEHSTCVLLELEASDGSVGVGEIPDVENPDELPTTDELESEVAAFLVGRDPRRITQLTTEMYDAVDVGPYDFHSVQQLLLGAIDAALYDLVGVSYEIPGCQLLGGTTGTDAEAAGEVPICWVVYTERSDDRFAALEAEIEGKVEAGFSNFKLKVGEDDPQVDARRIEVVREIAGEDANVFLDAQANWTLEEAIDHVRRFEGIGIDGVETPVGHPDRSVDAPGSYYDVPILPSELADLRARVETPLMEHVLDPEFGLELLAADAIDVFTVEACAGGIGRARRVLAIAEAGGVDARLGSTVELGPGTLAAVALAASSPAVTYPSDLIGPLVYADDVLTEPVEYVEGTLGPRDRPGFGIELRDE